MANRAIANSIGIRIWERRIHHTRGGKENFVEVMEFELDLEALGKGEEDKKEFSGGLR